MSDDYGRGWLAMGLRSVSLAVLVTMSVLLVPTSSEAMADGFWGPGYHKCGSFRASDKIYVSAKNVKCKKAMRVLRAYWLGPESEKELVGPNAYNGYVRLKRFPGWHCTSGAGAGGCRKGRKEAAYSTFHP